LVRSACIPDCQWQHYHPQDWGLARKACNTILKEIALEDPAQIQKLLHNKAAMFTSLDPTFVIELAAMDALMGKGGMQLMQQRIMAALPAEGKAMSLEHSAQLLANIKDSLLFKYTGAASRSLCLAIHEIVGGMLHGHAPKMEALNSDPFLRKVKETLPWFIVKQSGTDTVYGKSALEICLDELCNAEPGTVTYESLNIYHVFSWLLTEKQRAQVSALTNKVVQSVVAQNSQLVAVSGPPRLPCKKKGVSAQPPPGSDEVMALFE
jgi:hypothetical protein